MSVLGFTAKRKVVDLLQVQAVGNASSPLYGVQVAYAYPGKVLAQECVYGADGGASRTPGTAEGTVDVDRARNNLVVRVSSKAVALDPGEDPAIENDRRVEALAGVLTDVIRANRQCAGVNTVTEVTGYQWSNSVTDEEYVSILVVEVTTQGYVT